jgi:hypothetical protein
MKRLWIAVAVVVVANAAFAQRYDVVLAGSGKQCLVETGESNTLQGAAQWIEAGRSRVELGIIRFAPAPGGTLTGISGRQEPPFTETRADGTRIFVPVFFPFSDVRHLVSDATGNTLLLSTGHWGSLDLEIYDSALQARNATSLGTTLAWQFSPMDLAADQCTLVYASETGTLARVNVCATFAPLTDLDPTPRWDAVEDLRILPDGGVLIAQRGVLFRLNASAEIVDAFTPSIAPATMMLTRGGSHVMVAANGCGTSILEIDLAAHAETKIGTSQLEYASSMVPYYAWTAALGNSHAPRRRSTRN